VDLPLELASHLRDLVESIDAGDGMLTGSIAGLDADLRAAVSSYQGLRLTLVLDGWPITLTAFTRIDGDPPATSLRLALSVLGPGFDPNSRIVLYAGRPGSLVDLAADLGYLHRRTAPTDPPGDLPIVLDADLPPESVESGLSGLDEYAAVHRATGVLLGRGHPLDHAQAALGLAAEASGVTVPQYAARLLREEADRPASG
jgi:hypothetical protein